MFPASDAPTYRKTHGYTAALVFVVGMTIWCSFVLGGIEKWYDGKAKPTVEEDPAGEISVEETEVEQKSGARETVNGA